MSIIKYSFSLVLVLLISTCFGQDVIILKTTQEIKCKVTEIGITEVKYKLSDTITSPVIVIAKADIFMIKFANGLNQSFTSSQPEGKPEEMFLKGKADAQRYYLGYKGASTGTFISTLVAGGLIGLIPAIACGSTPPKEKRLDYPNSELFKNADYSRGYKQRARQIKSRKVWTNWGIAVAINVVVFIALTQ